MDYSNVTEITGTGITREALAMLYTRYKYAQSFCEGGDVLEVGCGTGQGLGLLATSSARVVGGDYTGSLLKRAQRHYGRRVSLIQLDGHFLPFRDASFDLVLLYEAIYYLSRPSLFIQECHRVLRKNGYILICSVNVEWSDFNPSLFSVRYFRGRELVALMEKQGFKAEIKWGFPVEAHSVKNVVISWLKRLGIWLNVIPKTMRGKEFFKRIFWGRLIPLSSELTEHVSIYTPPTAISQGLSSSNYKVFYAKGQRL